MRFLQHVSVSTHNLDLVISRDVITLKLQLKHDA